MSRLAYADSSALTKLVVRESESVALRSLIEERDFSIVTSRLAVTEVLRARLRSGFNDVVDLGSIFDDVSFRELTPEIAWAAGQLFPATLRSLDAIHLATAADLGADLELFLTYDLRLAAAARQQGLLVAAPA